MARPVVAVITARTAAKHGSWDDDVELVPASVVAELQQRGVLVVLAASTTAQSNVSVDLPVAEVAGIVVYTVGAPEGQALTALEAFASERSVPLLQVSGDGSVENAVLDSFAGDLRD